MIPKYVELTPSQYDALMLRDTQRQALSREIDALCTFALLGANVTDPAIVERIEAATADHPPRLKLIVPPSTES